MNKPPPSVRDTQRELGRRATCPEWLDELTQQLLAKQAADRPFSARQVEGVLLQRLIEEFGEEKSRLLTRSESPAIVGGETPRRTWVLWAVLAAIGAALAIAAQSNG